MPGYKGTELRCCNFGCMSGYIAYGWWTGLDAGTWPGELDFASTRRRLVDLHGPVAFGGWRGCGWKWNETPVTGATIALNRSINEVVENTIRWDLEVRKQNAVVRYRTETDAAQICGEPVTLQLLEVLGYPPGDVPLSETIIQPWRFSHGPPG